jgi:hypothetical protein
MNSRVGNRRLPDHQLQLIRNSFVYSRPYGLGPWDYTLCARHTKWRSIVSERSKDAYISEVNEARDEYVEVDSDDGVN